MTDTSDGAAPQRPPHAVAVPHGRHGSGRNPTTVELHPSEIRSHMQYMAHPPRRRLPLVPLLVVGAVVMATEIIALFGFKPMTAAGGAVGGFTSGVLTPVNTQELCKQQAEAQLALDRNAAQQKYNLSMRRWNTEMETLSRRLANEKSSTAMYVGQCGFAALLGPEAAELCGGLVALRYGPSLQLIEKEIARIERMRPEQPEILLPTYKKHLEACEAA